MVKSKRIIHTLFITISLYNSHQNILVNILGLRIVIFLNLFNKRLSISPKSFLLVKIHIFASPNRTSNIIAKNRLNCNTFCIFPIISKFICVLYISFTSTRFIRLITLNTLYFEIGSIVVYP